LWSHNSASSAIPDAQSPGHSACLVDTEKTPENTEEHPDDSEPVDEGDIQKEYCD
jgi:hypothetical protein